MDEKRKKTKRKRKEKGGLLIEPALWENLGVLGGAPS